MDSATTNSGSRPLGTGPGVFGHYGPELRVLTAAGEFWFTYESEEDARRVVTLLRERLAGDSPAAVRLREFFSWPNMMVFLGECFPADIPLCRWRAGSWPLRSRSPRKREGGDR